MHIASTNSIALQRAKQKIYSYWQYFSSEIDLSEFNLSTEDFRQLIPKLRKFKFLKQLILKNNKLIKIPRNIIVDITALEKLFVARNPISKESRSFLEKFSASSGLSVFFRSESTDTLETIYPSASAQEIFEMDSRIGNLYQRTVFKDGRTPSNILNGTQVIDNLCIRIRRRNE